MLLPSAPAMSIDAQFLHSAFGDGAGPDGEVWFAPSFLRAGPVQKRFGSLFVADLKTAWTLYPRDLGYSAKDEVTLYIREANSTGLPVVFSNDYPLTLQVRRTW